MIIFRIADNLGLDASYISKVARSASYRYKIYSVPKRKNDGFRVIHHPSAELKLIQRWLIENVFSHFPVHDSVYSYRHGIGIQDLARIHKKNNYLLRIDFTDYFPSIKGPDIFSGKSIKKGLLYCQKDAASHGGGFLLYKF